MEQPPFTQKHIRIPPVVASWLKSEAAVTGIPESEIIRRALVDYLRPRPAGSQGYENLTAEDWQEVFGIPAVSISDAAGQEAT